MNREWTHAAQALVVVADADGQSSHVADARRAFAMLGVETTTVSLSAAGTALSGVNAADLVLVDLTDSASADAAMLTGLRDIAARNGIRLVVHFPAARLDFAARLFLGGEAILLCEPDWSALLGACAVAAAPAALAVHDSASEEAGRLARLNEEVARIAETLARLTDGTERRSETPAAFADRGQGFSVVPVEVDPAEIRRAIRARRLRDEVFGECGLFEDPGWDILLDLFAAELERRPVSVSSLCIAAAVAPTTALRWIGKLIELGWLDRRADQRDKRRAFVGLTARASTAMRNYLAAVRRAGLGIA